MMRLTRCGDDDDVRNGRACGYFSHVRVEEGSVIATDKNRRLSPGDGYCVNPNCGAQWDWGYFWNNWNKYGSFNVMERGDEVRDEEATASKSPERGRGRSAAAKAVFG